MRVFISSTFPDLEAHRAELIQALRTGGHDPIDMEAFGPRSQVPLETCRRQIDRCDVFVGIYAHRYGSCPKDSRRSFTELEYDYASEKGKDRLIFLLEEGTAWPPEFVDDGTPKRRLRAFKRRLDERLARGEFSTRGSLVTQVMASVSRLQGREPVGRLRAMETLLAAIRDAKHVARLGRMAGFALIPAAPIAAVTVTSVASSVFDHGWIEAVAVVICWSALWASAAWMIHEARDCISGCQITAAYLAQEDYLQAGRYASYTACIEHLGKVITDTCGQEDAGGRR